MFLVVADSNALISVFRLSINIDEALGRLLHSWKIIVPSPVLDELERLALTKTDAKGALALAKRYEVVHSDEDADSAVLSVAKEKEGIVFTNDRNVLRNAKEAGIPRIYFRGKGVLAGDVPL